MVTGSFSDESVSLVAPARLWKASTSDIHNLAPKLLPHVIASVVILEGDGGVGTVKLFNVTDVIKEFTYVKDRIDVVDHENYTFKYTVLDGGLVGLKLKTCTVEIKYEPTSEGGTKTTMKVDYESLGTELLSVGEEGQMKGGIMSLPKAVEGYLLANPDAYA